jgi:hypothetical protein
MHFLQRSTHFSKTCCRPLITSKFLASELYFYGWKSSEIAWGEIWIEFCVRLGESGTPIRTSAIQSRSLLMRFLGFSNREKGAPRQEISKWSKVCNAFSRSGWRVVRRASLSKGGHSKRRQSPHLHRVPSQSNKVSPLTFHTALVFYIISRDPLARDHFEINPSGPRVKNNRLQLTRFRRSLLFLGWSATIWV